MSFDNVPADVPLVVDDPEQYARLALRTGPGESTGASDDDELVTITKRQYRMLLGVVGLCGEAGELAELVKKHVFHEHPLDEEKMAKEAGDVTWYLNYVIYRTLKLSWRAIWTKNINKLRARYTGNVFNPAESQNRKPGDD